MIGGGPGLARGVLFGRQVSRQARCPALVISAGPIASIERARDGEVAQQRPVVGSHHDVGGLHVPVGDPAAMGVMQPRGDLLDETQAGLQLQSAGAMQQLVQRAPLHSLHRVPEQPRGRAAAKYRNHVGVIERRGHGHCGLEPVGGAGSSPRARRPRQDLERDHPVALDFAREVNARHRAAPLEPVDMKQPAQLLRDGRVDPVAARHADPLDRRRVQ